MDSRERGREGKGREGEYCTPTQRVIDSIPGCRVDDKDKSSGEGRIDWSGPLVSPVGSPSSRGASRDQAILIYLREFDFFPLR